MSGYKEDYILGRGRESDFSGDPSTVVILQEGLHAARPVAPTIALMWYSTDIKQLFQWTSADGWVTIG